jgi:hypothetical protein
MNRGELSNELLAMLGEDGFVQLTQAFGGTRLYLPYKLDEEHEIAVAVGIDRARRLSRRYAPAVLRIPLAREHRALHYRGQGLSNAEIARKLGITESGVDKLFLRRPDAPAKGSASQLSLFES